MKRTRIDLIALASILFCTALIAAGFILYDNSQPHYKNNTKYQFSLPEFSAAPSAMPESAETVYLSASGGKYHKTPDCSALSRSKVVRPVAKEKALLLGKEPCSKCYP